MSKKTDLLSEAELMAAEAVFTTSSTELEYRISCLGGAIRKLCMYLSEPQNAHTDKPDDTSS